MRRVLKLVPLILLMVLSFALAADAGGYQKTDKEVDVCYDGHTKTIDKHDLRKWIKKGATEGPCQTTTTSSTTTTTVPEETTTTVEVEDSTTTTMPEEETTTTVVEEESFCVDLNTANRAELTSVSGVDDSMALAIIAATTFGPDGGANPFLSVADAQAVFGFGDDALAPQPGFPGYFSDDCLAVVQATTTTTSPEVSSTTVGTTTTTVPATTTTDPTTDTLPLTGNDSRVDPLAALVSAIALLGTGGLILRTTKEGR